VADKNTWKWFLASALVAEGFTLALFLVLPLIQGRLFLKPRFPHVIVFHHSPPSDIVDFQGNIYTFLVTSTLFWFLLAFSIAGLVRVALLFRSRDASQ
jgi:hypothetical protein